ncbi:MAG: hypothetical protein PVG26_17500 [Desulfobacterales bacterium]
MDNSIISTPLELARFTARYIEQFCSRMAFPSAWEILVNRHPKDDIDRSPFAAPLHTTLENQRLTIHLYEKYLMGISPLALQGWLNMELARRHLQVEPSVYRFNFDKKIRPLTHISGSGLQMVRHMVAHLETGLKNLIAAQMIIEMGNSAALLHYYTYRISPSAEEKENYQRLFPHQWIRAIFLCRKNKRFAPVALLADKGIAVELASYWWNCHAYISQEDKRFLETLFSLANQNPVKQFSDNLVDMFKFVKSQLFI